MPKTKACFGREDFPKDKTFCLKAVLTTTHTQDMKTASIVMRPCSCSYVLSFFLNKRLTTKRFRSWGGGCACLRRSLSKVIDAGGTVASSMPQHLDPPNTSTRFSITDKGGLTANVRQRLELCIKQCHFVFLCFKMRVG